jgi:hypothetical protein
MTASLTKRVTLNPDGPERWNPGRVEPLPGALVMMSTAASDQTIPPAFTSPTLEAVLKKRSWAPLMRSVYTSSPRAQRKSRIANTSTRRALGKHHQEMRLHVEDRAFSSEVDPVRVKITNLEPRFDSIETGSSSPCGVDQLGRGARCGCIESKLQQPTNIDKLQCNIAGWRASRTVPANAGDCPARTLEPAQPCALLRHHKQPATTTA